MTVHTSYTKNKEIARKCLRERCPMRRCRITVDVAPMRGAAAEHQSEKKRKNVFIDCNGSPPVSAEGL